MFKKSSLSNSYWIAFSILAIWVTFAYVTMHSLIDSQKLYGKLINLSGKQRMLSQKTALYCHLAMDENPSVVPKLKTLIALMKKDHHFISSNLTSAQLHKFYFSGDGLDAHVKHYFHLLDSFAANPNKAQLYAITDASSKLLYRLNKAVEIFENENSAKVNALKQRELFIYIGTLLTLILEAAIIIMPMLRLHKNYLERLEQEVKKRVQDIRIFAKIFENSREGMLITDADTNILRVNSAFSSITGYTETDAIGNTPKILHSGKHTKQFYDRMWQQINSAGIWQGEIVNRHKDGRNIYEHLTILKLFDEESQNYVSIFSDISERIHHQRKLHHITRHDALTGLLNRTEILNRIDHAITLAESNKESLAVVFIDLDNFKIINDSMGHALGDELLIEISKRISQNIRKSDTLGRVGGDEFVILIESLEHQGEEKEILENILKLFENPIKIDSKDLFLTASLGVVYYPNSDSAVQGCSAQTLIRKADLAMYKAKELGKNRIAYYTADLAQKIQSQLLVENQLRDAIKDNELQLFFQPKVDLTTEKIISAEVLLRWYNKGEIIPPMNFIPIAEESNLIIKIDRWVVKESIRLLQAMHENGYAGFSIALNISGRTFSNFDVMHAIIEDIRYSGLSENIEIEITEGVLVENLLFASNIMDRIKENNISLSLDDFGTGYSSFSYLSQMPFDTIKIDRSFIKNLHQQKEEILVEAMISFSKKLGMTVVAEGIEDKEQLEWLKSQECDLGQGYLFSKPVTYEEFLNLLDSQN